MADIFFMVMAVVVISIGMIGGLALYARRYVRVPPNMAMIVFGRRMPQGMEGYSIVRGGGRFIVPIFEDYAFLPLNIRALNISLKGVLTDPNKSRSRLSIKGVAQVKIGSDEVSLEAAAGSLLNKKDEEIDSIGRQIVEGHLRTLCSSMKPEKIISDRDAFCKTLHDLIQKDLTKVGMEILAFTIEDIEMEAKSQKDSDVPMDTETFPDDLPALKAELIVLQERLDGLVKKLEAMDKLKK